MAKKSKSKKNKGRRQVPVFNNLSAGKRSDLENMVGVASTKVVTIEGKACKIGPLMPEDFAIVRAHLRESQPTRLSQILDEIDKRPNLDDIIKKTMVETAMEEDKLHGTMHSSYAKEWVGTNEGMSYFLWLSVRRSNDEVTREDCFNYMKDMMHDVSEAIMDKIDEVSGLNDPSKKSEMLQQTSQLPR